MDSRSESADVDSHTGKACAGADFRNSWQNTSILDELELLSA
jgi:hypothetical protein